MQKYAAINATDTDNFIRGSSGVFKACLLTMLKFLRRNRTVNIIIPRINSDFLSGSVLEFRFIIS